ncbi:(deoxy)nucleoside triphosphate pyrophosphohydrolase [Sphingobacterium gobiense]|nr:(deoxy)nucleoside triphosphate pyrophosphohydrolase [Sphingobacterium gobiense]
MICQRSASMKLPLKWEFPGGKVETGETKEDCLKREIKEELGLEIEVGSALSHVEHHYPEFSLYRYPFLCKWTGGSLAIAEHAQAIWVSYNDLKNYDWAEADVPVVRELLDIR